MNCAECLIQLSQSIGDKCIACWSIEHKQNGFKTVEHMRELRRIIDED